jgi:hypothetical protein
MYGMWSYKELQLVFLFQTKVPTFLANQFSFLNNMMKYWMDFYESK